MELCTYKMNKILKNIFNAAYLWIPDFDLPFAAQYFSAK